MTLSFKEKVYNIVKGIPKGKTMTYRQVAELTGKPRAVGNILNMNKDSEIPCHRVVRSDGKIGGYNKGSRRKNNLLKAESVIVRNWKVVR